VVLRTLTDEERNARASALETAKVREAEERRVAEIEARRRNERDSVERTERERAEARKRDEEDRRRHDDEAKRKAEQEAKKRFGDDEAKAKTAAAATSIPINLRNVQPEIEDDDAPRTTRRGGGPARPATARSRPSAAASSA
jgi:translation initiation factor IF-2